MTGLPFAGPVRILLVEDNPGDVRLMREALRNAPVRLEMDVVDDGEEALAYLRKLGRYAATQRPHLVFLDLNLPRKDGREVLEEIKKDETLRSIPVIVLTTSSAEKDVQHAYELHANCYVTKPVELDQFLDAVKRCETFWLETARLPAS